MKATNERFPTAAMPLDFDSPFHIGYVTGCEAYPNIMRFCIATADDGDFKCQFQRKTRGWGDYCLGKQVSFYHGDSRKAVLVRLVTIFHGRISRIVEESEGNFRLKIMTNQINNTFVKCWSEYKRIDEEIDNYKLYDRVSFQLDIKKQGVAVLIDDLPG